MQILVKGDKFMQRWEQNMMIWVESMEAIKSKVVDIFNTKQTQLESCKYHIHTIRYAISTKQMQDLNALTCRNSIELNTSLRETHKYSKLPQKNNLSQNNTRKIRSQQKRGGSDHTTMKMGRKYPLSKLH